MSAPQAFTLSLTPPEMEAQCVALWQQFRGPSQVLSALVALQSLFASAPPAHRETDPYREIQAIISRHAENARAQLLAQSQTRLLAALQGRDLKEITRIHGGLSRNGFWQAASTAARSQEHAELAREIDWLAQWRQDARARAEAASGYPDALDFRAAGIVAEEYAAMEELLRCLQAL